MEDLKSKPKSKADSQTEVMENSFIEGYWATDPDPAKDLYKGQYQWPVPSEFPEKDVFLEKLTEIEQALQKLEKNSKGKKEKYVIHWRGLSNCRLCKNTNGSREFILRIPEGKVNWPEGFQHYVKDHGIRPTDKFLRSIMDHKK